MCSEAINLANSCYVDNWTLIFQVISAVLSFAVAVGALLLFFRSNT